MERLQGKNKCLTLFFFLQFFASLPGILYGFFKFPNTHYQNLRSYNLKSLLLFFEIIPTFCQNWSLALLGIDKRNNQRLCQKIAARITNITLPSQLI